MSDAVAISDTETPTARPGPRQFLAGIKTVTRRDWKPRTLHAWHRAWDLGRLVHDAWSKSPCYGGRPIGRLELTARPYLEQLGRMPLSDLAAEGGMCATRKEFAALVKLPLSKKVAVVRFRKLPGVPKRKTKKPRARKDGSA